MNIYIYKAQRSKYDKLKEVYTKTYYNQIVQSQRQEKILKAARESDSSYTRKHI